MRTFAGPHLTCLAQVSLSKYNLHSQFSEKPNWSVDPRRTKENLADWFSTALFSQVFSGRYCMHWFFFLDNAALVITTVAVMKICYNSHRLITRSSRLVSGQQKSKETQTNPHNNQPKPTKSDQSVVRQVKRVCALTTWCIAQKSRLSQHLQQLIECHTSNT